MCLAICLSCCFPCGKFLLLINVLFAILVICWWIVVLHILLSSSWGCKPASNNAMFFFIFHLFGRCLFIIYVFFQSRASTLRQPLKDVLSELAKFKQLAWSLNMRRSVVRFLILTVEMVCCCIALQWYIILGLHLTSCMWITLLLEDADGTIFMDGTWAF